MTAYFSSRLKPGVVLRVSTIRAFVWLTRMAYSDASVAMPDSRSRKLRAALSAGEYAPGGACHGRDHIARRCRAAVIDKHGIFAEAVQAVERVPGELLARR